MADGEIEISELEFEENLAGDLVFPVESASDTKATSLTTLKNWLKTFFVGMTENETITGTKSFSNDGQGSDNAQLETIAENIDLANLPASTQLAGISLKDKNGNRIGKLGMVQYSTGNIRTVLDATNSNGQHCQIAVDVAPDGTKTTVAPTPENGDSSTKIATTAFVNNAFSIAFKNSDSVSTTATTYTAPSSGVLYITGAEAYGTVRTFKINDTQMLAEYDKGHSSTTNGYWTTTLLLSKGDVVKLSFTPKNGRFVPFKLA